MSSAAIVVKVLDLMKTVDYKHDGNFVYELMDGNDCIYVGQTTNIKSRLYNHLSNGKKFDSVVVSEFNDFELNNEEAKRIVELDPPQNKALPPNDVFISAQALQNLISEAVCTSSVRYDHETNSVNSKKYISTKRAIEICDIVTKAVLKAEQFK